MPADAGQHARRWNIIDVLIQDHRDLQAMFVHVIGLSARDEWQRRYLLGKIITALVRHAIAEEQHLYPAVRARLPRGDRMADELLAGHDAAHRIIEELGGLDPGDMLFDRWFSRLFGEVTAHFEDEETNLFPLVTEHCDADTLHELGLQCELTKRTLPDLPSFQLLI
ncbi:MAG TPA: hemerythrin domain-containing protein [Streptosporangiaceae bacterium]